MNNNGRIDFRIMKISGDLGDFTRLSDFGVWVNDDTGEIHFKDNIIPNERKQNPEKYFLIVNYNPYFPDLDEENSIQEIILAEKVKLPGGNNISYSYCYMFNRIGEKKWQLLSTTAANLDSLSNYCLEYRELDEDEFKTLKKKLMGKENINVKLTPRRYGETISEDC